MVEEPSVADSIKILQGLKSKQENFHNVIITDEAIEAAVKLAKRYLTERRQPDSSIDLLDEAASALSIKNSQSDSSPIKKLEKKLDKIIATKEESVSNQDYETAARYRDKELEIKKEIGLERKKMLAGKKSQKYKVTAENIAEVLAKWTKIPVTKIITGGANKYANIEKILQANIIDQDEAVKQIAATIKRSRTGITNPNRPLGSFMFLGPSGVGKTELAKVLAREIFESEQALIKIDMSEFMEKHNTSRLLGAPPGYVGYDEGGKLTEAVRRHPYSVILLDEIEKAHPDVFNLLLQILEDGEITDAKGKKVNFKNTIVIMTSNLGSKDFQPQSKIGFQTSGDEQADFKEIEKHVMAEVKRQFRPEFLNRLDHIVIFHPLTAKSIRKIVDLQITQLEERLADKNIKLKIGPKALELLAAKGFDPEQGARPVRRAIQQYIEDPLAEKILEGDFNDGDTVVVRKSEDNLTLSRAKN
jgi:ATP-dependent Clp protease ATP-binding subunit ClpC